MVKQFYLAVMIISVLVLAACDSTATTDDTAAGDGEVVQISPEAAERETGLTATVSGAVEAELSGSGYFVCSDELTSLGEDPYLEIQGNIAPATPDVMIRFNAGVQPGTYQLVGMLGAMDSRPPIGEAVIEFNEGAGEPTWDLGTGELTLDAVPVAGGEPVTGSFNAQLTSQDAEGTVTVEGQFDFAVQSFAFDDPGCTQEAIAAAEAEREAQQAAAQEADLPNVPADLEGATVNITDVQDGFSAEDIPMRLLTTICTGQETQYAFGDESGVEDTDISLGLAIPTDMQSGTYPVDARSRNNIVGMNISALDATTGDTISFGGIESGAIRLDSLPTAAGEQFTGALSVTLLPREAANPMAGIEADESTPRIELNMVFNITAQEDSICSSN